MTTKTMKSAIIAGLTALVILGCFAGAASAAELNFTFNGSTTPIYTLNGVNWIPYVTDNKEVELNATVKASEGDIASYVLNMSFKNETDKYLLPVFKTISGWDQIQENNKTFGNNGHVLIDSAVVVDGENVSVNENLFTMTIIPNKANISIVNGELKPYTIEVNYTESEIGTDGYLNIADFGNKSVKGNYTFNILPDPFHNFTVYGYKYYNNSNIQSPVTAYVYTENGFNKNGNVIVATNISDDFENITTKYFQVFNLTMKYGETVGNKVWNITLPTITEGNVYFNTTLVGETDNAHAGNLSLVGMKWSNANSTNFKDGNAVLGTQQAKSEWNMKNESVALVNITLGPKGYNASGLEYNGHLLGEWNTNVQIPRLVSHANYTNASATWWNVSEGSAVTAYLNGVTAGTTTINTDGTYNFTWTGGKFIELNLTNHENFNITKVSENVNGNETVTLKIVGYKLGDVNFDKHINLVDSAVIGVMIGKDVRFDSEAGTADLKGLVSAHDMDNAITFITADIDKSGVIEGVAADVNDLRAINMYLIGTADETGN